MATCNPKRKASLPLTPRLSFSLWLGPGSQVSTPAVAAALRPPPGTASQRCGGSLGTPAPVAVLLAALALPFAAFAAATDKPALARFQVLHALAVLPLLALPPAATFAPRGSRRWLRRGSSCSYPREGADLSMSFGV